MKLLTRIAAASVLLGTAQAQSRALFGQFDADMTPADGAGHPVSVGDLDGDGDLDLLKGDLGELAVLLNRGDGSYTRSASLMLHNSSSPMSAVALVCIEPIAMPCTSARIICRCGCTMRSGER